MQKQEMKLCEKCGIELIGAWNFAPDMNCAKFCCECCPTRMNRPCLPEIVDGTLPEKLEKWWNRDKSKP